MVDPSKLELTRQELYRATTIIQKLKKERDDYLYLYENLKIESVNKKDFHEAQSFIETLRDANEILQKENKKLRKDLDSKDKLVNKLEEQLREIKNKYKSQRKSIVELEDARKELNYEITSTKFKLSRAPSPTELEELTETLIALAKENPTIHAIFKQTVSCRKKLLSLISSDSLNSAYRLVVKFTSDLIESLNAAEVESSFCSSDDDIYFTSSKRDQKNGLRESKEQESFKLKTLGRKLKENLLEHRNENQELRDGRFHKKMMSYDSRAFNTDTLSKNISLKSADKSPLSIRSPLGTNTTFKDDLEKKPSVKRLNRIKTSKSPLRGDKSPPGRFEEYKVPILKNQASSNMAECLGRSSERKFKNG